MSLYEEWQKKVEEVQASQASYQDFWNSYFETEKEAYRSVLQGHDTTISGTVTDLANKFNMSPEMFIGYLDGANESFIDGPKSIDKLSADDVVTLDFDYEKLYFNMHKAKAEWLFGLPEWKNVLSDEKRHEITKEYRASQIFVRESKIGRNDPCPCGSGKKYKNCCGRNA